MNRAIPIVLMLAAAGLTYLYTYRTYTTAIVPEQQQIADYNKALSAAATFSQKQQQLVDQVNAMPAADVTRLESFLPDSVDNIQLILDLSALAARTGVTLSNFSIQDTSASSDSSGDSSTSSGDNSVPALGSAGQVGTATLQVNVTGTYEAFRTFLAATEQSLRLLDVTGLSISAGGENNNSYALTFQLYWLQ